MLKNLIILIIKFYQRIWPCRGNCRFQPTCSNYTLSAIAKYGILKGALYSGKRLFRCHPWNKGGWDPI